MSTSSNRHRITARLTDDQHSLFRRRLFVEGQTIQDVLSALVSAYITGDVSVTDQGRYHLSPPSGHVPLIEVDKGADVVEIEPDWGIKDGRPQVGATSHRQKPRTKQEWGTRELATYLRKATGRRVTVPNLRRLLNALEIAKGDNGRWTFQGAEEAPVPRIREAIEQGVYDSLVQEGIREARKQAQEVEDREEEMREAIQTTDKQRRIQHLKRLRSTEQG